MTRKDHPTADVVYENIKENISQHQSGNCISRNLSLSLSEIGEIQEAVQFEVLTILMDALLHTATSCVRNADRFLI